MNATLYLKLLGSPHILLGDQPLEFITTKAQALLIYLAVTAHTAAQPAPHSRDALAALLWGEMADAQAKQNLHTVLPDLRRLVACHCARTDRIRGHPRPARPTTGLTPADRGHRLQRRSLLETDQAGFGLQNVVLEYATNLLTTTIARELIDGFGADQPSTISRSFLNRYALILAQAKEYVRASQIRLLLQPVAGQLLGRLGSTGAAQRLQQLLAELRTTTLAPGYAAANLLHLLLHLGVHLRGLDFSQLSFRQLYLRGVGLPATNFAHAALIESVFTEPFGFVYTATFSPDGTYLAAGTAEGDIYIWSTTDQQLVRVIHAHSQSVRELVFGRCITAAGTSQVLLASASGDASVGVWSLDERAEERYAIRLTHAHQGALLAVSFHAAGGRLTSVTDSGEVFVWDVGTPTAARLVHHFATTLTHLRLVAFSADGETVAVGNLDGSVLLWNVATGEPGVAIEIPTGPIVAVALRGDGRVLATGGRAGHLCL